jgi:hypothetical protein
MWEIDNQLQRTARPMIHYNRAASCWYSQVKGVTIMVNGIYNGWRMEDVWVNKSSRGRSAQERLDLRRARCRAHRSA